jgi:hypothetical protein
VKPHISATQHQMAGRCWEQYRRRYVMGEKIPPGLAIVQGSAYHVGAETNFRQKIESHIDLKASDIVGATVSAFEAQLRGDYQLTPDEEKRGKAVVLGEAKDQTALMAAVVLAEKQAPDYQPVVVEHKTTIVFPHATHDLLSVTDLRDDKGRVVDFKTAGKKPPQQDADGSVQLTIYAAAHMIDTGALPTEVRLDVATKTKKPARHVLSSYRDRSDFRVLLARTNAMLAAIEAFGKQGLDHWPAAPIGAWWCSAKWCGYAMTCPHFNAAREAASMEE